MLRTVGWLALPRRALSAGFDGGISPPFQFVAAQLLGGWAPTETGLSPASHSRLLWTHEGFRTPARLDPQLLARCPDPPSNPFGRGQGRPIVQVPAGIEAREPDALGLQ